MRRTPQRQRRSRQGWLAPIVALALAVVMGAVAVVLDRLWLDMAQGEAQSVADASALAAARQLASDDNLRIPLPGPEGRIKAAKIAAENVASMNRVAGQPFQLAADAGDVKFGLKVQVEETGEVKFVETIHDARAVQVIAQRTHDRGNPVALFVTGLTNVTGGEVRALAEATIDNHVVGLQSIGGARVPAIPLAILASDASGKRQDTWQVQIDQRKGADDYRFDPATGKVEEGPDGIPEIILTPPPAGGDPKTSNIAFFSVHGQAGRFPLLEQIRLGWSAGDLESRDGRLVFVSGPEVFSGHISISSNAATALKEITGECRAALLFQKLNSTGDPNKVRIISAGLVAGRVMAVQSTGKHHSVVFQPGVLATRSVVCPADLGMAETQAAANPYLYQMKLTQ